jgi:hypothetical protein
MFTLLSEQYYYQYNSYWRFYRHLCIKHDWLSVAKRPPADMWCIFRKYQPQQYLFTAHTWGRSGTTRGKIHDWRWATMCVAIWKQSSIDTNIVYEYHFYVHMMKGTNRQRLGIALTRNCKSRKDKKYNQWPEETKDKRQKSVNKTLHRH